MMQGKPLVDCYQFPLGIYIWNVYARPAILTASDEAVPHASGPEKFFRETFGLGQL
jgi:hypothetical protein